MNYTNFTAETARTLKNDYFTHLDKERQKEAEAFVTEKVLPAIAEKASSGWGSLRVEVDEDISAERVTTILRKRGFEIVTYGTPTVLHVEW